MNMTITSRRINLEQSLFWLAFLLAVVLRFFHLGNSPLTDPEAKWALQALEIARGSHPILGGQPGYLMLTAVNLFIFGGSNFMARFWPALVGSGLVLVPLAFQQKLGVKAAIILSFGLALDPGLLAISRMAGSPMLAVGFTGMCLAAWQSKRIKLAGFFGGMALLGGPAVWFGILGLGITWLFLHRGSWRQKKDARFTEGIEEPARKTDENRSTSGLQTNPMKTILTWGGATMLSIGTLFFLAPAGASAWAGSIVDFIRGWFTIYLVKPWFILAALLLYVPMAVIFAVNRFWRRGFKLDTTSKEFGILSIVFLLIALFYPAHQVGDLAWMLVPLWILASLELSELLVFTSSGKLEIFLASAMTFIFIIFLWFNMISIPSIYNNSILVDSPIIKSLQNLLLKIGVTLYGLLLSRLLIMVGALVLLILIMLLVSTIWDIRVARSGIIWGGTLALFLYTISSGMNAAGLRDQNSAELWQAAPQFVQADLFVNTIKDLSDWKQGHIMSLNITVESSSNTQAVTWLLRDWHVTQVDSLSAVSSPDLVILPKGLDVKLTSAYRGQDFVYKRSPIWDGLNLADWIKWLAFRQIPEQSEDLVLWARNDLFQDAGLNTNTSTP